MQTPPSGDPRWIGIITGKIRCNFDFLAAKILLGRLQMLAEAEKTPQTLGHYAEQLRDLMQQNVQLPSVQRDLKKIFGEGGAS